MTTPLRVAAFSGSLRKASYNTALLRAAQELAPAGMTIEIVSLADMPLLNMDLVSQSGEFPEPVTRIRAAVAGADAVLIATPEYNYSLSSVTKTVVDWLSRPPHMPLEKKPVAIMGASVGRTGTARGQMALRGTLSFGDFYVMSKPEVLVMEASKKFDGEGKLTDEPTREQLGKLLVGLAAWTLKMKA
jgi:chromate reductase, NAD(P)H dehydrogenase (quinone)